MCSAQCFRPCAIAFRSGWQRIFGAELPLIVRGACYDRWRAAFG
jgi:hypothetical protein